MKITAIKQQVKRANRYSIFVDGAYTCSLSEAALLESRLASGQELDTAQLKILTQTSHIDKIYGNALRYVAMRPRSEWELETYLKRKMAEEPVAEQIMTKLRALDLLNDQKFAEAWVANRRLLKPISRRRLQQELKLKRIAEDIIAAVLQEDETDESSVLYDFIVRKRRQTKYHDDDTKLMQYLARQGFGYEAIKDTLFQVRHDEDSEQE